DGDIILYVKGNKSEDRSGVSAEMITLNVDNAEANKPKVSITNPNDGTRLFEDDNCSHSTMQSYNCEIPVKVSVESKNPIKRTQIRINSGPWKDTKYTLKGYTFNWQVSNIEDKTYSIEARAIDTKG